MGYRGKLKEKEIAIALRRTGHSYSEILQQVSVSKDTLSRWCRDIVLSKSQIKRLQNAKLKGSYKGRLKGAKLQQEKRKQEELYYIAEGKRDVLTLNKRDIFISGISLYSAEGSKRGGNVWFSNSDPLQIAFMMKWYRLFCNPPESKYRVRIWLHDKSKEITAKQYWSQITGIPSTQFHKTYIAKNKLNSAKIRYNKHPMGVVGVGYSDVRSLRQILGWISALFAV